MGSSFGCSPSLSGILASIMFTATLSTDMCVLPGAKPRFMVISGLTSSSTLRSFSLALLKDTGSISPTTSGILSLRASTISIVGFLSSPPKGSKPVNKIFISSPP
ncbi:104aa long hypothetical protein [Pyrococcus horikoshii OT3]|uniref:Uncharacterized protein n=1 Tax=Pyrococcus horikoshii (strain ATCC 700860 / DSM 12428 / JCM 9974 / NBRC 100139 / OT-3) TaxID=70601 RepID=O58322_PYRHO|nr:104aa long hypothetical protein [Pyrococcus horikoshii OT3]